MKIKGLYFIEDIIDEKGKKISRIMFNNECYLEKEVNEYLWEIEKTKTNSYNTIKRYGDDLCYFYNYLLIYDLRLSSINFSDLGNFIEYLKKIKVKNYIGDIKNERKKKYAIEKTLIDNIEFLSKSNGTILVFGRSEGLNQDSIKRIFITVVNYLRYLEKFKKYEFDRKFRLLIESKDIMGILKAKSITKRSRETVPIDSNQLISQNEYELIMENSTVVYGKLLLYILYNTGMRIGEALGLKIGIYNIKNLKESLKEDVVYQDGRWLFKIVYRPDNENYKLAKGHISRNIYLKKTQCYEFEILLEKYLIRRNRIKKEQDNGWLFISNRGNVLTQDTAYKWFKGCLDKSSLYYRKKYLTLHSTRHTFITREIEKNVPVPYVSLYVGHKNINSTINKYLHLTSKSLSEIREKYDEYTNTEFNMGFILDIDIK
ncbi:MAG: tyrosine-type recombinase/integrase [Clostridium sp.]|uniref:tyrosine-type recombinase/integrase n=1 Tax=Clostridium sp. TaxID=1506 RepID=UPI0025BA7F06|nr:tyrosine-type recombinase/integrase [Clostridium sp.]MBS4958711.1 tyrosine-type recombinase/integrase [Clostridium sp.]